MLGILLNKKFLHAGQMLISLLTHATELNKIPKNSYFFVKPSLTNSFKHMPREAMKAALDASFGAFGRDFEVDGWLRF